MTLNLKNIFLTLILTDLFAVSFLGFKFYNSRTPKRRVANFNVVDIPRPVDPYNFEDPMTAFYVLEQLDVFEPVDDKYYNNFPKVMNLYHKPVLGLKLDENYCTRHRAYFADHPETIFEEKNFIMDYGPGTLVRNVGTAVGADIQPKIGAHMAQERREKFLFDIRPEVGIFFTNDGIHTHQHLGKNFGCLTQIANHIPGRATLNRKDYAAESVVSYAKKFETRPHCFNYDKFFPKTWVLRQKDQCEDFFENMFRGEYYENLKKERTIVYIRKIGAGTHQGAGVQPVNATEEQVIRDTYKDGALCGQVNKSTIIQTYIYNPLLLDDHKFDFRIYMVIGSTNPTIAYYHDGFLRVSLHPYNISSEDKGVLLTNTALSHKIFDIAKKEGHYQGLNETQLRNFQMWNFARLQEYLMKKGMINDPNWVDNYLRPEFMKAMIHLVRMTEGPFLRRSQVYELFGVDFMIDKNLKLWFIEANSGPVLEGSSEEKEKFITKMLKDQFEIVFGMLRSRAKRIIIYVNTLVRSADVEALPSGEVLIKDLEAKRQHFKEITKNYFEPEFEPSPDNGFHKIIDDNLSGTAKYAGLIAEECL